MDFSIACFCFVLGYVCELFSELVGFLFGCYCSVVFSGLQSPSSVTAGALSRHSAILAHLDHQCTSPNTPFQPFLPQNEYRPFV